MAKENYINYKDKLAFEGEFLNDRWNGKGKEYNMEGELVFEGEFLKDKRWNIKA